MYFFQSFNSFRFILPLFYIIISILSDVFKFEINRGGGTDGTRTDWLKTVIENRTLGVEKMIKKVNFGRLTKRSILSVASITLLGIAPLSTVLAAYLPSTISASAEVLDITLLSNMTSVNSSGTSSENPWALDGSTKPVNFTITGGQLADVSAARTGTKQVFLGIPNELNGKVTTNGPISFDSDVTLNLQKITFLNPVITSANVLLTRVAQALSGSLGSLTGVTLDVTEFNEKLAALSNIESIGNQTFSIPPTLDANGHYITANIDNGLGIALAANVKQILLDLNTAVQNLEAKGSGIASNAVASVINLTLAPAKVALTNAITSTLPLLENGGTGVTQLTDAAILGQTAVVVPTNVTGPTGISLLARNTQLDLAFPGVLIQTDTPVDSLVTYFEDYQSHIFYGNK